MPQHYTHASVQHQYLEDRQRPNDINPLRFPYLLMLVAIHQPNFLLRPKVLDKLLAADLTIWLDDVQYARREWQNRALFHDPSGQPHWLSVPVLNKGHRDATIAECEIVSDGWGQRQLRTIQRFYARSPWLREVELKMAELWAETPSHLAPLAIESADCIADLLGKELPSTLASNIAVPGRRTRHLVALCQSVGATAYLTGSGGLTYLEFDAFREAGIEVFIQTVVDPQGPFGDAWWRFSSLDYILSHGPQEFEANLLRGQYVDAGASVGDS